MTKTKPIVLLLALLSAGQPLTAAQKDIDVQKLKARTSVYLDSVSRPFFCLGIAQASLVSALGFTKRLVSRGSEAPTHARSRCNRSEDSGEDSNGDFYHPLQSKIFHF